ncbi:BTAD domain-containing putative transcriptional regulator [Aquihabitans daechungensis]|uniref:BTAD domain-containing putative transcriptional regulator n=1 Tax=Aquihabitans daechungensis TaxID=1052257 RepID=UPI003BA20E4C
MLALYRCGRQPEAVAAFEQTRDHLAEELGLDPPGPRSPRRGRRRTRSVAGPPRPRPGAAAVHRSRPAPEGAGPHHAGAHRSPAGGDRTPRSQCVRRS